DCQSAPDKFATPTASRRPALDNLQAWKWAIPSCSAAASECVPARAFALRECEPCVRAFRAERTSLRASRPCIRDWPTRRRQTFFGNLWRPRVLLRACFMNRSWEGHGLHILRKHSRFDSVLKGCGFSRTVTSAESMRLQPLRERLRRAIEFFPNLFSPLRV